MGILGKLAAAAPKPLPSCSAVIAAGGSSQRMGGQDKLFADLAGKPVLLRSLLAFENSPCVGEILVVVREESVEKTAGLCAEAGLKKVRAVLPGGADRLHSVWAGVMAVSRKARLIAVHDGARPLVSGELIQKTVAAAARYQAALPLVQMRDTIKTLRDGRVDETLDRSGIYAAQTPQVFQAELLKAALQNALDQGLAVTDDAQAAERIGLKPAYVEGERSNLKITGPEDIWVAQAILGGMEDADRTGI